MKKKVLIIAYHFPPQGGGGVQRTLKFSRYLPLFGWEPVILTVSNPDSSVWDYSLIKEVPNEIRVFRVPSFEFSRWEKRFFSLFKSGARKDVEKKENGSDFVNEARISASGLRGLLKKIYLSLTGWLRIPDDKVGWNPFALFEGLALVHSKKIGLIYTSSPPHSSHLVGLLLSRLTGKPWVADFRDDWLENDIWISTLSRFRLRLERYLANEVFTNASYIIANTEHQQQTYTKNYPDAKRIETINNGYDAEDIKEARHQEDRWQDGKLHLCHTGYFYPGTALTFFETLREFFLESPEFRGKIQLDLVGFLEEEYQNWIISNQLAQEIKPWGYVDHQTSIKFLLKSHLLLYLIGSDGEVWKGEVAGKLYEYLASGKPILAFAPKDGESEKIISQANSGWVLDLKDRQGVKSKLKEISGLFFTGKLKIEQNKSYIEGFERKNLTRKLSQVFENCLTHQE